MTAGPRRATSEGSDPEARLTPDKATILDAIATAAAVRLCPDTDRLGLVNVLMLRRDYDRAAVLRDLDDETFGRVHAEAAGRPIVAPTPRGSLVDLDAPPKAVS